MRRPFVIGNWKMNGTIEGSRELAVAIDKEARSLSEIDIGICPPFVRIAQTAQAIAGGPLQLGAQDCAKQSQGAFTGEVSARMLEEHGCRLVLLGHSERRTLFGETDADVAQKAEQALEAGLMPVICVGESLDERKAGRTEERVGSQLDAVLDRLQTDRAAENLPDVTVAYEPIWAIGTGLSATPEQAGEVHAFLRRRIESRDLEAALRIRILYGGSVGENNARELFAENEIDGALVGGASLEAESFAKICRAASQGIHRSESDRSG